MTPTSSTYQGIMVSARSRRLRIIGSLLLVAIIGMSIYGIRVLMPVLQKTTALVAHASAQTASSQNHASLSNAEALSASPHLRRLLRIRIIFSYGYWTCCAILFLSLLLVVWLDLREVTRNYADQRRKIWTDSSLEWPQKRRPAVYAEDADRTTQVPVNNEESGTNKE